MRYVKPNDAVTFINCCAIALNVLLFCFLGEYIGQHIMQIHPEYIIDADRKTTAVILPFSEWQNVLEELEELADIRAYDEVKSHVSDPIPFSQAIKDME